MFSLEHAARHRGYELALASLPDMSSAGIRDAVRSLLARGVEGIILEVPNHLVEVDEAISRRSARRHRVWVGFPGSSRHVVVDTLQAEMGRLATEHLLGLGHETVFHLAGPVEWDAARERREGWSAALAAAGRRQPEVLQGDWSARSGYELGAAARRRPEVTAIFTANDSQAMGVMRALTEAGRSVPGDVSVVGNDDIPEAEFLMVPLTTLRTDQAAISDRVLSGLVALIEGRVPEPPGPPISRELVVRSSTGPPPRRSPRSLTQPSLDRPTCCRSSIRSPSKEGTHAHPNPFTRRRFIGDGPRHLRRSRAGGLRRGGGGFGQRRRPPPRRSPRPRSTQR